MNPFQKKPIESISSLYEAHPFLKSTPEGVLLNIRVQPGARKTTWSGRHGQELKLSIHAHPIDGAANQGCIRFLAQWFGVKQSQIILRKGEKSRSKVFLLKGQVLEKCLPLIPIQTRDLQE